MSFFKTFIREKLKTTSARNNMKILLTGISGFLGSRLSELLADSTFNVIGSSREGNAERNVWASGDIDGQTDWHDPLTDCDIVIHTAGRAHILKDDKVNAAEEFMKVNFDATIKLAEDAYAAGVKQFIFISSIGVNGDSTTDKALSEQTEPNPTSLYAVSKYKAEKQLLQQFENTTMGVTIIRPALICGPKAPGNIERLLKLVASGLPLPFRYINNARSMVSLDNVCHFVIQCINNPMARNEVFVLADEKELSIEEIVSLMAEGMEKKKRLIYIPPFILKMILTLSGKRKIYEQLFGSLKIDATKSRSIMPREQAVDISETILITARDFYKDKK